MNYTWAVTIEKLMLWRAGSWHKYDMKTTTWTLRLTYDMLFITADTKVFESISLQSKIKGIYKGDILILIISNVGQEVKKIKFQIKGNVAECLETAGKYFPVLNHDALNPEKVFEAQYRKIDEVMKVAVEAIDKANTLPLHPEFRRFVKLCLLDPTMPQIISDTQKVLEDLRNT